MGSLGFLGSDTARVSLGCGVVDSRKQRRQSQGGYPFLARRRSEPHRHLGSEDEQQLQADLDQRRRNSDLRAAAEDGEANGQVRARPFHAHARHRPSAGDALRHHRPRGESGDAVPEPRIDHHQRDGSAQCRARARAGAQVGPLAAVRGVLPRIVPRRRLRSDVHPGPEQAGLRSYRPESAEERFTGGGRKPVGVPEGGGPALSRAQRDGGTHQYGCVHRAGAGR